MNGLRLSHGDRRFEGQHAEPWIESRRDLMALLDSSPYRIPACLRDLVMVDFLELTGTTTAAAQLLNLSQPSVSRRYRSLADDLGLERQIQRPFGRRYSDADWMSLLRRGVNRHRLSCGVLRIGGLPSLIEGFRDCRWIQWVPLDRQANAHWPQLLELDLLDAVALESADGLEEVSAISLLVQMEIKLTSNMSLLLVCRRDPLILEIAGRYGNALQIR
jgi:hypothetical protein